MDPIASNIVETLSAKSVAKRALQDIYNKANEHHDAAVPHVTKKVVVTEDVTKRNGILDAIANPTGGKVMLCTNVAEKTTVLGLINNSELTKKGTISSTIPADTTKKTDSLVASSTMLPTDVTEKTTSLGGLTNNSTILSKPTDTTKKPNPLVATSMIDLTDRVDYATTAELKPFLRKIMKKFPSVVEAVLKSHHNASNILNEYNTAHTKTKKTKVVNQAVSSCHDLNNIIGMVKIALEQEPAIAQVDELLAGLQPKSYPLKVPKGHPILSRCFLCKRTTALKKRYDLKICSSCSCGTYTKQELKSTFCLSPSEMSGIPYTEHSFGGWNRSGVYYIFKSNAATLKIKKKFGSMFNYVNQKLKYRHSDILER